MLERAANLRARRSPLSALESQLGPAAALGGTFLLLVVLARTVGLGVLGWTIGLVGGLTLTISLARALWNDRPARLGSANWVTLLRATLVVGVAALTAASFERSVATATLVTLASVALTLDFVDGWIARRTATESALGAKLDGEVDAFLLLALSVEVAPSVGAWVLAIGLARYVFLAAGWAFPWMRAPLPRRDWRKTVTASQGVALVIAAADVVPSTVSRVLLAIALALLAESFGRDVWWLWRRRHAAPVRVATASRRHPALTAMLTLCATAVIWAGLVAPIQPWLLTPRSFVRLPLEGLVVVGLAIVLPIRARRVVLWVAGPAIGVLILVKILDVGFFIAFDRPFDPVEDWSYFSIGVSTVGDTFGNRDADLAIAAGLVVGLAALVIPSLALGQLTRVAVRHRRRSGQMVAVLTAAWVLCWVFGAQISGIGIASTSATRLAVNEVHAVRADLRAQAQFAAQIERPDAYRYTPSDRLLRGLRGKDVLLVFIESYGRMAVQGTSFSPGIDAVVDAGTRALRAHGFSSRSAWVISPTFGGGSWLADSTLQSGMWVDTPGRYSELIASKRATLTSLFRRAGWKTIADLPATHVSWPEGHSFYHFEKTLVEGRWEVSQESFDRESLGYHGPGFGFSPMPDQYALQGLQRLELAPRRRPPVFSEIFLTSSHEPWTRIPPLIAWNRLGNGSIFWRLPIDRTGLTNTQQGYAKSIKYSLSALYSFVERYGTKNTVLIVLGDEQPSRVINRPDGHEVPITIIARDPNVIGRIAGWGWTDGMLPAPTAPVWPSSSFRNRFLDAFDH
ncbi:MAG TPA: CDP-alcohol phosphatidyltransferase family protein [Gaiellaceae bacterium]|nr:CDP-alcohol phosphatidyltransferase family protein [Gaiellaceae bacterium]